MRNCVYYLSRTATNRFISPCKWCDTMRPIAAPPQVNAKPVLGDYDVIRLPRL